MVMKTFNSFEIRRQTRKPTYFYGLLHTHGTSVRAQRS